MINSIQASRLMCPEYNLATSKFRSKDNAANFNGVKFSIDLDDSTFQPCRRPSSE